MAETELERLVVRLLTDVEGYIQPLREAVEETKEAADKVEDYTAQVEAFGDQLVAVGSQLALKVTAPLAAAAAGFTYLFSIQESEEIKLRGILEANERQVDSTFESYTKFASALQEVTTVGDEVTIAMQRTAESLGVTGKANEIAIKESIGLAAAMNMSARSSIRYTAMLAQGDTTMLQHYLPTLRLIEDEEEKVAEAHRVLARMFAVAEAEAKSFSGQLNRLGDSIGDLGERFGEIIAKYMKPFIAVWHSMIKRLLATPAPIKHAIVVLGGLTAAIGPVLIGLGLFIKLIMFAGSGLTAMSFAATLASAKIAAYVVWTKIATIATIFWNAVTTPVAMIAITAAIVAATAAVVVYTRRIREAAVDAKRMGDDATRAMQNIEAAAKDTATSLTGVVSVLESLEKKLSTVKAPSKELKESLLGYVRATEIIAERLSGLRADITEAREVLAEGIIDPDLQAPVLDWLKSAEERFRALIDESADLDDAMKRIKSAFSDNTEAIVAMMGTLEGVDLRSAQEQFDGLAEQVASLGNLYPELTEKGKRFLEEAFENTPMAQVQSEIEDVIFSLRGLKDGWDETTKAVEEFRKKHEEATEVQVQQFQRVIEERTSRVRAGALEEQYATPFERAKKEIEDLNRLAEVLGKEFDETYSRAAKAVMDSYQKTVVAPERYISQGVQAIRRGSVQEAVLKREHQVAMTAEKGQTTQEKQLEALMKIKENTEKPEVIEMVTEVVPANLGV